MGGKLHIYTYFLAYMFYSSNEPQLQNTCMQAYNGCIQAQKWAIKIIMLIHFHFDFLVLAYILHYNELFY